MSKQRIRWVVALMAVGLLGLVGLQTYYITSAWRLQREQFDYKVTDALQEVVRTLERREMMDLSRQRIRAQQQQQRLMAISRQSGTDTAYGKKAAPVGSVPKTARRTRRAGPRKPAGLDIPATVVIQSDVLHSQTQPITPEQALVVATFFEQQEMLAATGNWQAQAEQQRQFEEWANRELVGQMNQFNDELTRAYLRADSLRQQQLAASKRQQRLLAGRETNRKRQQPSADSQSIGQRAEEQTQMVKGVLKELLLSERPIGERLDRLTLDTLLRESLKERGIQLPFAYGVQSDRSSSGKPQLLFTTYKADTERMLRQGYRAVLFPNNLIDTGNHLYLYFPTRQDFIWSQMGFTLAASALLILTILTCFYIAITTIIRQKKMADIKNDFINNMTHEFKTPISTISLAVEMAEELGVGAVPSGNEPVRADEETGRMTRYLGIIRDETRRLGSHVEKVLQMALLDRGAVRLTLVPVNVHDVIEKVLNTIGLQLEQRQGELVLEFEAADEIVEADEVHLTNILYNLVDNAIKYSPGRPHLTIRTQSLPEGVCLTVADQGLGLSKEQQGRIFETFYRVPTGNLHDVKGFGLGLSYVRKMVEAHHGRITVTSTLGQGSAFNVVIPYTQT